MQTDTYVEIADVRMIYLNTFKTSCLPNRLFGTDS